MLNGDVAGIDASTNELLAESAIEMDLGTQAELWRGTGQISTDFRASGNDQASAVLVREDGRIVVVGSANVGQGWDFGLAGYNSDGTLDGFFGSGARVTTDFADGSVDRALAAVLQPDGRIVVGGFTRSGSAASRFALARYKKNGHLDPSFGDDGKIITSFSGLHARITGLALQPDGKIVASGYTYAADGNANFTLVRYNRDGTVDATFGQAGVTSINFYGNDNVAYDLALDARGRIVVGGWTNWGGSRNFALVRLDGDGSLDSTFGMNGRVRTIFGNGADQVYSIAVQADGKIIAAGSSAGRMALARYNANGTVDEAFAGGRVVLDAAGALRDLAVLADGSILGAGRTVAAADGRLVSDFALVRLTAEGTLDASFGGSGLLASDLGSFADDGRAMAVQPDGRIVVAGSLAAVGKSRNYAVARFNIDGGLDELFDMNIVRDRPIGDYDRVQGDDTGSLDPDEDGYAPPMLATDPVPDPKYYRLSIACWSLGCGSSYSSGCLYVGSPYGSCYVYADSPMQAILAAIRGTIGVADGGFTASYTFPDHASPSNDSTATAFEVAAPTTIPNLGTCYGCIWLEERFASPCYPRYWDDERWDVCVAMFDPDITGNTTVNEGAYTLTLQGGSAMAYWDINWGDGTTSSTGYYSCGQFYGCHTGTTTHTYSRPGNYTICATPRGGLIQSSEAERLEITVQNVLPTAPTIYGPPVGNEGTPANFGRSQSSDPGTPYTQLTYDWEVFNAQQQLVASLYNQPYNQTSFLFTPPDNDFYTVKLSVDDHERLSPTEPLQYSTRTITIANVDPANPTISESAAPQEGMTITLTGSASDVAADQLTYAWTGTATPTGQTTSLALTAPTHEVGLTVQDEDGGLATLPRTYNTIPAAPTATAQSAAWAAPHQINLCWNDVSQIESGYQVEQFDETTSSWTLLGTTAASATSFAATGPFMPNQEYQFRIRAVTEAGVCSADLPAECTTPDFPAAPSGLAVSYLTSEDVTLTWVDSSDDESCFEIGYSDDGGGTFTTSPPVERNRVMAAVIDTFSDNTAYVFRIRATNSLGASAYATCEAQTPATPAVPGLLQVTAIRHDSVTLAWTDASSGESAFAIEQSTAGGEFMRIGSAPVNAAGTTIFRDYEPNAAYAFRIRAYNAFASSPYSNTAVATTGGSPADPSNLTASFGNRGSEVSLNWADNATDEEGYVIEYGTDGIAFGRRFMTGADPVMPFLLTGEAFEPGALYYFRVQAYNRFAESQWTQDSESVPCYPTAPADFYADLTATDASFFWTDPTPGYGEDGFIIDMSADGGQTYAPLVGSIPANATEASVACGFAANTTYHFRISVCAPPTTPL